MKLQEQCAVFEAILNREKDNYFLGDTPATIRSMTIAELPASTFPKRFQEMTDNLTFLVVSQKPKGPVSVTWVPETAHSGHFVIQSV